MKPIRCHLLIGQPASGKSYLSKQLAEHLKATIISTDQIRFELYGDEKIQGNWNEIEEILFHKINQNLLKRKSIIIDATHAKSDWRTRWTMEKFPVPVRWVGWWLDTSRTLSLKRNRTRTRVVPDHVIINNWLELQINPPQINEGFSKIYRFDYTLKTGINKFKSALNHEVKFS